jgi:hypothetical protein
MRGRGTCNVDREWNCVVTCKDRRAKGMSEKMTATLHKYRREVSPLIFICLLSTHSLILKVDAK